MTPKPLPDGFDVDRSDDDHVVLITPDGTHKFTPAEAGALAGRLASESFTAALRAALDPAKPSDG